jgi:hypothetical protein
MKEARGITMLHRHPVSLLAFPAVVLFACMEVEQPLGDSPSAGQGGSAGTTAGAGTGGSAVTGGAGGRAAAGTGGSGNAPGSGGSGNASSSGGSGNASSSGGSGNAPSSGGSASEPGEAGSPPVGGSGGSGGTTSTGCYSPSQPHGALNGAHGCACGAVDEDQCIRVVEGGRQHLLAFSCRNGAWESVEDGACNFMWACLIDDRVYEVDGNEGFPSPLDECNSCGCSANGLSCTEIGCEAKTCPEGTRLGEACLQCGSPGGCALTEYGCIQTCDDARDCPQGSCVDGICSLQGCI